MLDSMLARKHVAVSIQGQLANIGAILALYQHQLAEQLGQEGADISAMYQLSALLVKQATGRAVVSLMLRSHLWLPQALFQGIPGYSGQVAHGASCHVCARRPASVLKHPSTSQWRVSIKSSTSCATPVGFSGSDLRVCLEVNQCG